MRIFAFIGALAIVGAVAAAVFFFGGFYSVAQTEEKGVVAWALATVRASSIARHAGGAPPISLDDPATVQAGARAYAAIGCVNCHGGPGVGWAKFSEGLQPVPADLKQMGRDLTPSELFWAVKNGVTMTGMPGFGAAGASDQQIWTIVAFLRKWPTLSEADYKAWTAAP
ncbi:MAG: c-type cytochrome [Roseiarcus sp.]